MTPLPVRRRTPLAGVALLLALAGSVRAQDTTALAGRPALDVGRVQPGSRSYRLAVLRHGLPTNAGQRVVSVRETFHGDIPAWSIVETRLVAGGSTTDSVVVARADLAPLHWEASAGGARLVAGIARDTLYGAVDAAGERRNVVVGGVSTAVLNAAMLETLVSLLPLDVGFEGVLPLVVVAHDGGRVVPMQVVVERADSLLLPSGPVECWVVSVRNERVAKTLWVSRDGRGVVRIDEPMPDVDGATLEQLLTATTPD